MCRFKGRSLQHLEARILHGGASILDDNRLPPEPLEVGQGFGQHLDPVKGAELLGALRIIANVHSEVSMQRVSRPKHEAWASH